MQIAVDIFIAVASLLLGAGIKALIDLRKAKPEIKSIEALAEESEAKADKMKAEVLVLLIQSYQSSLNDMSNRMTTLVCEVDKITASRELAQRERDEMKARADEMQRQIERLSREREQTEQQRDHLQVKLYDLENKTIPAMQEEIKKLRQMVIDLGGRPPTGPLGKASK